MRLVIVGASGRMGCALVRGSAELPASRVVAGIDRADSPAVGRDFGELAGLAPLGIVVGSCLDDALSAGADVVIDFSSPSATAANLATCARRGVALLVGTTGLGADVEPAAAAAAAHIPVLIASNTSLGVTLLAELVRAAARALPGDFDIEIIEAHHRFKKDAPSGTALTLGRAAAEGRGQVLDEVAVHARAGLHERVPGEIGFATVRGGDIVGEHSVLFAGTAERLVLSHVATDRAIFARGALRAGQWLVGKAPGRYQMADVIGLKTIG